MLVIRKFWFEEDGQDMVEYALLLAFIALAATALLSGVRDALYNLILSGMMNVASACQSANATCY